MASNLAQRLAGIHPRNLAMRGEGVRKKVASEAARRELGACIAEGLADAGYTPKSAGLSMGYADDTTVNRWINGADETPNIAKLDELPRLPGRPSFKRAFSIARARRCDELRVTTTITDAPEPEARTA